MKNDLELSDYPVVICVAGSRSFHDRAKFDVILKAFLSWAGTGRFAIISGKAYRGPDKMAIEYCEENNVPCFLFPADWERYGKRAGFIRNAEMREHLTHLLAIWDGKSRGTLEMIEKTKELGHHVSLVIVKPDPEWIKQQRIKKKIERSRQNNFENKYHDW